MSQLPQDPSGSIPPTSGSDSNSQSQPADPVPQPPRQSAPTPPPPPAKPARPEVPGMDADLQAEIDAALGGMSLDDIMAADEAETEKDEPAKPAKPAEPKRPSVPGLKRGRVVGVDNKYVLVDLGGKSQAVIPTEQFEDQRPRPGDTVEGIFDRYDAREGLVHLSRKGAVAAAAWETLEVGQVVEGMVTGVNKGGLELSINNLRAFMPASQVDVVHVPDISVFINEKLRCQVTDLDRKDKNLIVSRRALVELEREQKREELWQTIQPDQVLTGVVRNIMPYGAFVDIGGADGLLHISDLAHGHVSKVEDVIQQGQNIEVKVLKIDREARKISLGLKQMLADPWQNVENKYPVRSVVEGTVTRLADFGAFVELEPGVDGLIPVSEISWTRVNHPRDELKKGQAVRTLVLSVDPKRGRISLSLKQAAANPWTGVTGKYAPESTVPGKVTRLADFGAFVELEPGVEGLVHVSQLSDKHVKHPSDVVKEGQEVQVRILSVDEDDRKISLSMKTPGSGGDAEAGGSRFADKPKPKRDKPLKGGIDRIDGSSGLEGLTLGS